MGPPSNLLVYAHSVYTFMNLEYNRISLCGAQFDFQSDGPHHKVYIFAFHPLGPQNLLLLIGEVYDTSMKSQGSQLYACNNQSAFEAKLFQRKECRSK